MKPCIRNGIPCNYHKNRGFFTECELKRNYHECDPPTAFFMKGEKKKVKK